MNEPVVFRRPESEDEALAFFRIAAPSLLVPLSKAAGWLEREGSESTRVAERRAREQGHRRQLLPAHSVSRECKEAGRL